MKSGSHIPRKSAAVSSWVLGAQVLGRLLGTGLLSGSIGHKAGSYSDEIWEPTTDFDAGGFLNQRIKDNIFALRLYCSDFFSLSEWGLFWQPAGERPGLGFVSGVTTVSTLNAPAYIVFEYPYLKITPDTTDDLGGDLFRIQFFSGLVCGGSVIREVIAHYIGATPILVDLSGMTLGNYSVIVTSFQVGFTRSAPSPCTAIGVGFSITAPEEDDIVQGELVGAVLQAVNDLTIQWGACPITVVRYSLEIKRGSTTVLGVTVLPSANPIYIAAKALFDTRGTYTISVIGYDSGNVPYPALNNPVSVLFGVLELSTIDTDTRLDVAYSDTVIAQHGTQPYTYAVTAGSLPTGLTLDEDTGEISGTPTVIGTYNFTITATDSNGITGTKDYSLSVVLGNFTSHISVTPLSENHLPEPKQPSSGQATFTKTGDQWLAMYVTSVGGGPPYTPAVVRHYFTVSVIGAQFLVVYEITSQAEGEPESARVLQFSHLVDDPRTFTYSFDSGGITWTIIFS
jgi:hypothetical protein